MIEKGEIQKIANEQKVQDRQIEKDYVIGWILKGISQQAYLSEHLVFKGSEKNKGKRIGVNRKAILLLIPKGGTVLKKVWFDDYRFSEDMDFTFEGDGWDATKLETEINTMCDWVYEESRIKLTLKKEEGTDTQYRWTERKTSSAIFPLMN